jgi:hypothetical protein
MKTNRSLKSFTTIINQKIQYNSNKSQEITLRISLEIQPKSPLISTGNQHWTRRKTHRKNRVFLSGLRVTGSGSLGSVGFDSRVQAPGLMDFFPQVRRKSRHRHSLVSPASPSSSTGRSGPIFPISLPLRSLSLSWIHRILFPDLTLSLSDLISLVSQSHSLVSVSLLSGSLSVLG